MKSAIVLGGAGFLGSHICDALIASKYRVTAIDNLSSGSIQNIKIYQVTEMFKIQSIIILDTVRILSILMVSLCPLSQIMKPNSHLNSFYPKGEIALLIISSF